MLADEVDFVIGVDTHRDRHALAVVVAPSGGVVLVEPSLPACPRGYERVFELAQAHAPRVRVFAIEGTGSYGAGLARFLAERGERVHEVERPRRSRGQRGKSDTLDAVRAARCLLGQDRLAQPRAAGQRAALQALLRTREGALEARRAALCQLRALIVTAPTQLREELRSLTRARLLKRCANLRPGRALECDGTRLALRLLARRIALLTAEERALQREIAALVERLAQPLLNQPGVGAITAAQVFVAWSHRGRVRSEAAFARLAGAPPIPASSGRLVRHRLDRGGDPSSTVRCTRSSSADANITSPQSATSIAASLRARARATRSAASSATSLVACFEHWRQCHRLLDIHRSVIATTRNARAWRRGRGACDRRPRGRALPGCCNARPAPQRSVMWLLDRKAWYMPAWLDQILPRLTIEPPVSEPPSPQPSLRALPAGASAGGD